ncbi:carboxymethylenebutenolidase [Actinopolyspora erythraea]|uniref:Carboxymethylenebutenolidase n=1 Tax=Actinopolyspora erythraea TaxID=414996 RepID=A0A099DCM7_9ACTN|nr:dienelactone hydrolase family protein [Actinopolyspora erythraea]ASU77115.1 carboxymethylenebutenolidase [Actinopolyspora erythraea]KGI83195.1 carboxymethylenebutenolidase [Actinopolyspora erythraea]
MIQTRTETIALTNDTRLRLTAAEPENVVRGGIVVLHEAGGVTERTRALVAALAEEGWLTVAPHLYHRDGADEDESAGLAEQVSGLSGDSVLADTDAAFVWLADRGVSTDRQGIIGFDVGGSAALLVASNRRLGAAVTVGGDGIAAPLSEGFPPLVDIAGELSCPWLGLYGEADTNTGGAELDKLRAAAAAAEAVTDVVRYPKADHRFDADPDSAKEAWQRARNWLDVHLR